ncbi:MAG: hypothetical protein M1821_001506 [Bathelium mastoideum]|nr:MAG: hypothetical protein M1821_001506 [Bathelium mastoideum]
MEEQRSEPGVRDATPPTCSSNATWKGKGDGRLADPQPPHFRARQRLPWLAARGAHTAEQKQGSKKSELAESDLVADTMLAKPRSRTPPTATTQETQPTTLSCRDDKKTLNEFSKQEERNPLLKPEEFCRERKAVAKSHADTSPMVSPSLPSAQEKILGQGEAGSIRRSLSRQIKPKLSTPFKQARYRRIASSEESMPKIGKQRLVPQNYNPAEKYIGVRQISFQESNHLKSALDGLEELMNEAVRMAERGISREQEDGQSSPNDGQVADIASGQDGATNATGPLQVSSSSSLSDYPLRMSKIPVPYRWRPTPAPDAVVDSAQASPLENLNAGEDVDATFQGFNTSTSNAGQISTQMSPKRSRNPGAIDWAYVSRPSRPTQSSPSSGNSDSSKPIVRQPEHVHGPTLPVSILPPNREQLNYLDRKLPESADELKENPQRFYTAPELHHHHFVEGWGRGRRRRGAPQLFPRPQSLDEDVQWQPNSGSKTAFQHLDEKLEVQQSHGLDSTRGTRHSPGNSSIGPEPSDGKLELGDAELGQLNLKMPRRHHHSLVKRQPFSMSRHHRRQPVARDWHTTRKRLTAFVACMNTVLLGLITGVYALAVQSYRSPATSTFRAALLVPRAMLGLALGLTNINCISVLLDLFGSSLQSKFPHQEVVNPYDPRRHGGGLGLWLGFWTWCSIGSLAVGFCIGAVIIEKADPAWGFYVVVIFAVFFLLLNVLCPETRRSRFRRTLGEFLTEEEQIRRRVARGEVKLHISQVGPKWWFEELLAGLILIKRMLEQTGFLIMAVFTAWIYAQIVLIIVLLGALLSRTYVMRASSVGLGVLAIAVGSLLAIPLSKANIFSRDRRRGQRTDSMTFEHNVTWSSHFARRLVFTTVLPLAAVAYTAVSVMPNAPWIWPVILAGLIGFLSNLGMAECYGLVMETYDTSDLQPGANSRHRLQSLAMDVRRRRTNYSSFPRVSAGIFATQGISFLLAAGATGIGGKVTRDLGAPLATGIWAAILMGLTVMVALVLWRFKSVRVIPEQAFGTRTGTRTDSTAWQTNAEDDWKPVVIGNPSGKTRRMNLLELGGQSRWVEIRRLNKLQKD